MINPPEEEMKSELRGVDTGSGQKECDVDPRSVRGAPMSDEARGCAGSGKASSAGAVIMEYVNALIVAAILAAFIMTFVARSFLVQGSSMEPTLHHGERLLVNRFVYRFSEPERGDIVVFRYPKDPRQMFIKRVIGIPGDVVEITGGVVYINGIGLTEPYIAEPPVRAFSPTLVPTKRVFVLGDNRNSSHDSTYESVGMVSFSSIQGKAFFVYWPLNRMRTCKNPSYLEVLGVPGSQMAITPGTP